MRVVCVYVGLKVFSKAVQSGVALLVIERSHFLYACLKLFKQRRKIALLFFEMRRYTPYDPQDVPYVGSGIAGFVINRRSCRLAFPLRYGRGLDEGRLLDYRGFRDSRAGCEIESTRFHGLEDRGRCDWKNYNQLCRRVAHVVGRLRWK